MRPLAGSFADGAALPAPRPDEVDSARAGHAVTAGDAAQHQKGVCDEHQ